jgi:hypothetical protein
MYNIRHGRINDPTMFHSDGPHVSIKYELDVENLFYIRDDVHPVRIFGMCTCSSKLLF